MSDVSPEAVTHLCERLLPQIGALDRIVRRPALERVAARALLASDSQVAQDTSLVLALARASDALLRLRRDKESATVQSNPLGITRELLAKDFADLLDSAWVGIRAARGLVSILPPAWQPSGALDVDTLLTVAWSHLETGNPSLIREEWLLLLEQVLIRAVPAERAPLLGVERLRTISSWAGGVGTRLFVQAACLRVLALLDKSFARTVSMTVLADHALGDATIPRAEAVRVLCQLSEWTILSQHPVADPSEHVRQTLARSVVDSVHQLEQGGEAVKEPLALLHTLAKDDSPRVAGATLVAAIARADSHTLLKLTIELVNRFMSEGELLLVRVGLYCAGQLLVQEPNSSIPAGVLVDSLQQLLLRDTTLGSRQLSHQAEYAAYFLQQLQNQGRPDLHALSEEIRQQWQIAAEGDQMVFEGSPALRLSASASAPLAVERHREALERAVLCAAADDLGASIRWNPEGELHVFKGERRHFVVWRWLFEATHWAPDKRPGYAHTAAGFHPGDSVILPIRMAEVTPTRVPGERQSSLGNSWGGFLPRVSDLQHACARGNLGVRMVTSFGTLTINGPTNILQRLWLRVKLTFQFSLLSNLRQSALTAEAPGRQLYVERLRQMGLSLVWSADTLHLCNKQVSLRTERVTSYYSVAPFPLVLWLEDALQYIAAPSGNSAFQLAVIVWVLLVGMIARAAWTQTQFEAARRKIPLSIGGWGSRGKSGTERLKAALFHSQHCDVVSKTTGCEAMMIVARRGQTSQELFLYRPYDKATIWEQEQVVKYAEHLGAQVFLWECMALQPDFVDILNRQWMKDSVTTITNAYPDHEDVMGPSGEDVARVVGSFVPTKGKVLCSEYQMLPIVRESARVSKSQLIEVNPLEGDLLPLDLVERFPYQEHPYNIALALRLAEQYGLSRERALVDIADFVFPDLGVLKTFREFEHRRRRIVFSNGMSANERAGFLSNWERLGFAAHDPDESPKDWLVAVINNRADRVPRSRVFADVFAGDATVDLMLIIGSNQSGMRGFLRAAAQRVVTRFEPDSASEATASVERAFAFLGVPQRADSVVARLQTVLEAYTPDKTPLAAVELEELRVYLSNDEACDEDRIEDLMSPILDCALDRLKKQTQGSTEEALLPAHPSGARGAAVSATSTLGARREEIRALLRALVQPHCEYRRCRARARALHADATEEDLQQFLAALRRHYLEVFFSRIHIVENTGATGDQVIDALALNTPPGLRLRVLGTQNIKGAGLDFIYRLISIDRVQQWLEQASSSIDGRAEALTHLANYGDYGVVDSGLVAQSAQMWLHSEQDGWQAHRAQLEGISSARFRHHEERWKALATVGSPSLLARLFALIEPAFDHLDSIRRRRRARAAMRDLILGKESVTNTVTRLRAVVARGKGGWLAKDLGVTNKGQR